MPRSSAGQAFHGARKHRENAAFAEHLKQAMWARGWTTSETARRVREHLGSAKFATSHVSHYTRGRCFPRQRYLEALSLVLGIDKAALVSQDSSPIRTNGSLKLKPVEMHPVTTGQVDLPAFHIEDRGEEVLLQINQQVPWS